MGAARARAGTRGAPPPKGAILADILMAVRLITSIFMSLMMSWYPPQYEPAHTPRRTRQMPRREAIHGGHVQREGEVASWQDTSPANVMYARIF